MWNTMSFLLDQFLCHGKQKYWLELIPSEAHQIRKGPTENPVLAITLITFPNHSYSLVQANKISRQQI